MTTLREDVAALARRTAEEFNTLRAEIGDIEIGGVGGETTATKTIYGNYGFDTVADALDSVLYKTIDITSFSNDGGTKEKGSILTQVNLAWAINKDPVTLTLDGNNIDTSLRKTTLTDLNYTNNKTWKLVATDEKGASDSMTTTISFYNGVYYGVGNKSVNDLDSSFILSLNKSLRSTHLNSFTANPATGQYIYYIYPSSFKQPIFYVGGFEGGFEFFTNLSFTNNSGYTESYTVYRSTNSGLGSTDVTIK